MSAIAADHATSAAAVTPAHAAPIARAKPGPARPAIRINALAHTYPNGTRALQRIDCTIPAGRHTVIVGPSGSGKTTLLACLAGRLQPTGGSVERAGTIATIYQDLRLTPERSVLANVLDGALGRVSTLRSLVAFPGRERERARRLLERVDLAHRLHQPVANLSGGERQRVAIARALMQKPDILLADEPVCALDRENAQRIMRLLRSLSDEYDVTLVSVLHDDRLAAESADQQITIRAGRIVAPAAASAALNILTPAAATTHAPACAVPDCDPIACGAPRGASSVDADEPRVRASAEPPRPAWMHPAAILVIGVLGIAAYAWSTISLGLHETNGRSAVAGTVQFLKALIPTSTEQLAAIPWASLLASLVETLQMSLLGTTIGIGIAYPLSALAAQNTGPRVIRPALRVVLNGIRTVPSIIWALLFVAAVGFGPLAGVLALSVYSVGYLSKFFYEAFENAPTGAQSALRDIGATGIQRFTRAVAPASRAAAITAGMFMLEYNVRSASILGIVDAGGIGYYIKFYLDVRNFPAALACLALIFGVVLILDHASVRLRRRLLRV